MLEILQVPMVEIEHNDQQIVTLASSEITELWPGKRDYGIFLRVDLVSKLRVMVMLGLAN